MTSKKRVKQVKVVDGDDSKNSIHILGFERFYNGLATG
jgi:hypothetical protein